MVLNRQLWDTSWLLPQGNLLGRVLHTLIGYTDRPTELQLVVYVATLALMIVLTRAARPPQTARAAA